MLVARGFKATERVRRGAQERVISEANSTVTSEAAATGSGYAGSISFVEPWRIFVIKFHMAYHLAHGLVHQLLGLSTAVV